MARMRKRFRVRFGGLLTCFSGLLAPCRVPMRAALALESESRKQVICPL